MKKYIFLIPCWGRSSFPGEGEDMGAEDWLKLLGKGEIKICLPKLVKYRLANLAAAEDQTPLALSREGDDSDRINLFMFYP